MKVNNVYIVDDDTITIFGLRKLLTKYSNSIHIEEFRNGRDALEAIFYSLDNAQSLPEIIFLDINMPIMDGWAFLDEFLKLPKIQGIHIKIITSSIDVRDRQKWKSYIKKSGLYIDFITKPIYELNLDDLKPTRQLAWWPLIFYFWMK